MDIVAKLEDAYAFLGDPLHREAADKIERLRGIINDDRLEGAADEIERLQSMVRAFANEIERLRKDAKRDAKYILAYHRICQKHGIAPSPSELIEAMKEGE